VTVNVYDVPLVRPAISHVVAPLVVHVRLSGAEVTVKPVIEAPPVLAGAVQEIVALALRLEVASTAVGAPATVEGPALAETASSEDPLAFIAATANT
jgi:hypothetical protein